MKGVHYGMNRLQLDRIFRELGGKIVFLNRTGDVQYRHHVLKGEPCPRANARRKDSTRKQVRYVMRVIEIGARVAANDDKF